jgi:hypothetical protein
VPALAPLAERLFVCSLWVLSVLFLIGVGFRVIRQSGSKR